MSETRPWSKFWHASWAADLRLRGCSLAERGLFWSLYALAHQDLGALPSMAVAASAVGVPLQEAESAIKRLVRLGLVELDGERVVLPELARAISLGAVRRKAAKSRHKGPRGPVLHLQNADANSTSTSTSTSASLSGSSGESARGGKKAPETWQQVLARREYEPLRADARFGDAWQSWVEHCGERGAKATMPAGTQAAALLNKALRAGSGAFAQAVEDAIAGNWRGVNPAWGQNGHAAKPQRQSAADLAALKFGVKD